MIVTSMQPYFFPYIGYFQLLDCGEIFVLLDDVQFIKQGWVNRNRILINHEPYWLTFPVQKAARSLPINQRYYVEERNERDKILDDIKYAYGKAPQFKNCFPFIEKIMSFGSSNVSEFNANAIKNIASLLDIKCQIVASSKLQKNNSLKGQDRVIEINRCLDSSHYINSVGGVSLYQERNFLECGVELSFLQIDNVQYHQSAEPFVPSLSIIDVLMFCSLDEVKRLLKQYRLIKHVETN